MTTLSDFQAFAPCETTPCTHTYQANLADTPWCPSLPRTTCSACLSLSCSLRVGISLAPTISNYITLCNTVYFFTRYAPY